MDERYILDNIEAMAHVFNAEDPSGYYDTGLGVQWCDVGHITNTEGTRLAKVPEETVVRPPCSTTSAALYRLPSPLPRADSILSWAGAIKHEQLPVCVKEASRPVRESVAPPLNQVKGNHQVHLPDEQSISCGSRHGESPAGSESLSWPSTNRLLKGGAFPRGMETERRCGCRTVQERRLLQRSDRTGQPVECTASMAVSRERSLGVIGDLGGEPVRPPLPHLAQPTRSAKGNGAMPVSQRNSGKAEVSLSPTPLLSLTGPPLACSPTSFNSAAPPIEPSFPQPSPFMSFLVDSEGRGPALNVRNRPQSPARQSPESDLGSLTLLCSSNSDEGAAYSFYAGTNDIIDHSRGGRDGTAMCTTLEENNNSRHLYSTPRIFHEQHSGCRGEFNESASQPYKEESASAPGRKKDSGLGGLLHEGNEDSHVLVGSAMSLLAAVTSRRRERRRCVTIVEPTLCSTPASKFPSNRLLLQKAWPTERPLEPLGQRPIYVRPEKQQSCLRPTTPQQLQRTPTGDSLPVTRARKPGPL